MRYANFIDGSYEVENAQAATEQTWNMYVQLLGQPGAKTQKVLNPFPGLNDSSSTCPDTPCRGLYTDPGTFRTFGVFGTKFYELTFEFPTSPGYAIGGAITFTNRMSAVASIGGSSRVTIVGNGRVGGQLIIQGATGSTYLFDLATDTLTTLVGTGASGFTMNTVDTYFVTITSSFQFAISDPADGATWDPLQVVSRSKKEDPWGTLGVSGGDVYLLGPHSTEVWWNSGASPFPFELNPTVIPYGYVATGSVLDIGGALYWLARSKDGFAGVVRAVGTSAEIVTPPHVASALEPYYRLGQLSDAESSTYSIQGQVFYELTFPTANMTWVYCVTSNTWSRKGEWSGSAYNYWRPRYYCYPALYLVCGHGNKVYWVDPSNARIDRSGNPIRYARRAPVLSSENRLVRYFRFALDLEVGVTSAVDPPMVELRYSNDGGKTFASAGERSMGLDAETTKRVFWLRLGAARNRVFEVVCDDDAPFRLMDAYLEVR